MTKSNLFLNDWVPFTFVYYSPEQSIEEFYYPLPIFSDLGQSSSFQFLDSSELLKRKIKEPNIREKMDFSNPNVSDFQRLLQYKLLKKSRRTKPSNRRRLRTIKPLMSSEWGHT
ncbi:uncharacterized protein PRCAT00002431001 [Priceomyces carsonii]|uniref:uncharacterized protein n=1 Tax=Priceomyces carsonii TaxID=28549 RepID=UPI002ED94170|nr:unnamed protein product [Priceomyces carsonii]